MDDKIKFQSFFKNSKEFGAVAHHIERRDTPQAVFGMTRASFTFSLIAHYESLKRLVIIVENEAEANKLKMQIEPFVEMVDILPKLDMTFFASYYHSHENENSRIKMLYHLIEKRQGILIMPVDAMFAPMVAPSIYAANSLKLKIGDTYERDDLIAKLVSFGYTREDVVESRGQFAVRGGVIDVFVPLADAPLRIELFGDDVDSLRTFDVETLRSIKNVQAIVVRPCREALLFDDAIQIAKTRLKKKIAKSEGAAVEILRRLYDNLDSNTHFDEQYKFLPELITSFSTIFDYIDDCPVFVWGYNRIVERNQGRYEDWVERFKTHFERGEALESQLALSMKPEQWLKALAKSNVTLFSNLKTLPKEIKLNQIVDYHFREGEQFYKNTDLIEKRIKQLIKSEYTIWLMVGSQEKAEGIKQLLNDHGITAHHDGRIKIFNQAFETGFLIDTFKAAVITEHELYGTRSTKRLTKIKRSKTIKTFTDLSVGDYVVHDTHGIGKYLGVTQLKVDMIKKDFLKIVYRSDDVLYVPVEKMEVLQKYVGADAAKVRVSKLGGTEWQNTKQRVKKAVEDMTDELIELYAKRAALKGFAYSKDGEWQRSFEDAFPYRETPDQLKCIDEIKRDMEQPKPMDRLLCGDVGYGKTEVALRAVFKAVADSKQVAILVPTTVLAQQHYDTLIHRCTGYPINIGVLSRFRSKREIDKTVDQIRTGVCDVVVGTHRLLSKDIQFKDLGLLVIDEEQRFGVKFKEKIKQLKTNIDVLTLTATPIPRTLHMSLVGIRDLSTIEDPPEDRYPIQTYVLDYQPNAIREAILRELDRMGQVYFVHNRVHDIDRVTAELSRLVPEAKIAYAHGQMKDGELEDQMYAFMNGEFDVLVSTTIVETGLDISNVNTMIINDADRFGLSQLYQLRGRIGRSNRLAYAYLTYRPQKILSEVAEKRLSVIKTFTDVGSGFKIAMRDLELRGAGSLLGTAQSGHMVSVGYEMYCKLIETSIAEAKGEHAVINIDASVELPCQAYIPEYYIDNSKFKIELYKRISAIRNMEDKHQIEDDLYDLYGDIPQSVNNLIGIGYIRAMAAKSGIEKVERDGKEIHLIYADGVKIDPRVIATVMANYQLDKLRFVASNQPEFVYYLGRGKIDENTMLSQVITLMDYFEIKQGD